MDIGLLILRVVVGLLFVGHGAQKLFGWFGGYGLQGTGGWMESLGYRPGKRHASLAGLAEFVGGALLVLGLFTPIAAAMIIGVMLNALVAVHRPHGMWVTEGGMEYPLVLIAAATAMAFTGARAYSLDAAFDLDLNGWGWGLAAVALGIAAAAVILSRREQAPGPATETAVTGQATTTTDSATRADDVTTAR